MTQRHELDQPSLFASPPRVREIPAAPASQRQPRGTPPPLPAERPARPVEFQELWDIDQVADYLGVPKQTIYGWRITGYGPRGFRVGKHLRWHAATVIQWTLGLASES